MRGTSVLKPAPRTSLARCAPSWRVGQHAEDLLPRALAVAQLAPPRCSVEPHLAFGDQQQVLLASRSAGWAPRQGGPRHAPARTAGTRRARSRRVAPTNRGPSLRQIASDDCVWPCASTPARAAVHVAQRQLPWERPPPAAEPRIRTRRGQSEARAAPSRCRRLRQLHGPTGGSGKK
jgi:hypothetical protein